MKAGKLARQAARELRKNMTDAEKLLWLKLKGRQFMGLRFLRQHPIFYLYDNERRFFIADFYCHEIRLVIELDGSIHIKKEDYDQTRTDLLGIKNLTVIRFANEEVLTDMDKVLLNLTEEVIKFKEDHTC